MLAVSAICVTLRVAASRVACLSDRYARRPPGVSSVIDGKLNSLMIHVRERRSTLASVALAIDAHDFIARAAATFLRLALSARISRSEIKSRHSDPAI